MIIPAGHKVLIKPKPVETKRGDIFLVVNEDKEIRATTEGEVIALGETAYLKVDDGRPWVKPGDYVLYGKYAGALAVDPDTNEVFVVIHDIDVVAKVTKKD